MDLCYISSLINHYKYFVNYEFLPVSNNQIYDKQSSRDAVGIHFHLVKSRIRLETGVGNGSPHHPHQLCTQELLSIITLYTLRENFWLTLINDLI